MENAITRAIFGLPLITYVVFAWSKSSFYGHKYSNLPLSVDLNDLTFTGFFSPSTWELWINRSEFAGPIFIQYELAGWEDPPAYSLSPFFWQPLNQLALLTEKEFSFIDQTKDLAVSSTGSLSPSFWQPWSQPARVRSCISHRERTPFLGCRWWLGRSLRKRSGHAIEHGTGWREIDLKRKMGVFLALFDNVFGPSYLEKG